MGVREREREDERSKESAYMCPLAQERRGEHWQAREIEGDRLIVCIGARATDAHALSHSHSHLLVCIGALVRFDTRTHFIMGDHIL